MLQTVRTLAGILLLILGVIGSLLPVIPGFVFFAAAIAVLGTNHFLIRRGKLWLERWGLIKPSDLDEAEQDASNPPGPPPD